MARSSLVYRFLSYLTITRSYQFVFCQPRRRSWYDPGSIAWVLYRIGSLWMILTMFRVVFDAYLIANNQYSVLERLDAYIHLLSIGNRTQDLLFFTSVTCYIFCSIHISAYIPTKLRNALPKVFQLGDETMRALMCAEYSLLDCLFVRLDRKLVAERRKQFWLIYKTDLNPFVEGRHFTKIDRMLKMIELSFSIMSASLLVISILSWAIISQHYIRKFAISGWRCVFASADVFGASALNVFFGILTPLLLSHLLFMVMQFNNIPVSQQLSSRYWKGNTCLRQQLIVLRQMFHRKSLFVFTLQQYKHLNDHGICTLFTRSVLIVNCAATILTLLMLISDQLFFQLSLIISLMIIFTAVIILVPIHILTQFTMNLYSISGIYIEDYMSLLQSSRTSWRHLVQLGLFIEVVHPRRKWCFTLASFGKINKMSVVKVLPMYTSFIMFILPLILPNKSHSLET